ncbi:hypothetical protein [Limnobacter sp.]|jgi:hypothetical protein|uniref:hypothetical protein n=1 Tax=Limnobacter sp. TaxID=2003368 RepID=UPI0027B9940C|nr:hypothetical protein [Limnobacter sp.]
MNNEKIELNSLVSHYFSQYPPLLTIKNVAEILGQNEPTIRAQILRKVFPIRVRKEPGLGLHVLLIDLVSYITNGKRQVPIPDERMKKMGGKKRGRPTKQEEIAQRATKAKQIAKTQGATCR